MTIIVKLQRERLNSKIKKNHIGPFDIKDLNQTKRLVFSDVPTLWTCSGIFFQLHFSSYNVELYLTYLYMLSTPRIRLPTRNRSREYFTIVQTYIVVQTKMVQKLSNRHRSSKTRGKPLYSEHFNLHSSYRYNFGGLFSLWNSSKRFGLVWSNSDFTLRPDFSLTRLYFECKISEIPEICMIMWLAFQSWLYAENLSPLAKY